MGNIIELWENQVRNCDTYVLCSTLNQIVNYLPLKEIVENRKSGTGTLRIINITYKSLGESNAKPVNPLLQSRFQNENWDKNLMDALDEKLKINLEHKWKNSQDQITLNRVFDEDEYEDAIRSEIHEGTKVIIWNLTGGQRGILLSVMRFIEKDNTDREHMILYLEGNSQGAIVGKYEENNWKYAQLERPYGDSSLTIRRFFQLAGYQAIAQEEFNFDENKWYSKKGCGNEIEQRIKAYKALLNEYKQKKELRKSLILNNKEKGENKEDCFREIIDKTEMAADLKKEIIKSAGKKSYPFGYVLEFLTEVALLEAVKGMEPGKRSCFQSIGFNVDIQHNNRQNTYSNKVSGSQNFCQLDLVLLLKSGQTIVFECKSGNMDSVNAKSREFTAYALGGVYGKPVLIIPLISQDIEENKTKDNEDYGHIWASMGAAGRAGLDICLLDELPRNLELIFNEFIEVYNPIRGEGVDHDK